MNEEVNYYSLIGKFIVPSAVLGVGFGALYGAISGYNMGSCIGFGIFSSMIQANVLAAVAGKMVKDNKNR